MINYVLSHGQVTEKVQINFCLFYFYLLIHGTFRDLNSVRMMMFVCLFLTWICLIFFLISYSLHPMFIGFPCKELVITGPQPTGQAFRPLGLLRI